MPVKKPITDEGTADSTRQMLRDWASVVPGMQETAFCIQVRIAEIDRLAVRCTNAIAAAYSLDHIDVRVLMAIKRAHRHKAIRPTDLCKTFGIAPSAITRQLDRLVELGLVRRNPDPTDRRAYAIELTAKGEKSAGRIVKEFHQATRRRTKALEKIPGAAAKVNELLGVLLREWAALDGAD